MKNIVIIGILIVAVLAIGGYVVSNNNTPQEEIVSQKEAMMEESRSATDSMAQDEAMMEESEKMENDDLDTDSLMTAEEAYIPFSDEAYESASDTDRVLFFYASWCPTCRPIDTELQENISQIPEGVTVLRVNYEDPETDASEKALAKEYGVTYQHTFVIVDQDGEPVVKWNGGGIEEILKNLN